MRAMILQLRNLFSLHVAQVDGLYFRTPMPLVPAPLSSEDIELMAFAEARPAR